MKNIVIECTSVEINNTYNFKNTLWNYLYEMIFSE